MKAEDFIKILPIFLSLLALLLAYIGYKKFISRQTVTKQIDHLSNLINEIQSTKIQLKHNTIYNKKDEAYHTEYLTLFEVGNIYRIFKDKSEEFREKGVVKYREDDVFPYHKYVYHPLTPSSIADCLAKFIDNSRPTWFLLGQDYSDRPTNIKGDLKFVEVMTLNFDSKYLDFNIKNKDCEIKPEFQAFVSNSKALTNYFEFGKYAYELEQQIRKWFRKVGIDDVNIRKYDNF
ncbi:MAG: hypothetical protein H7178_07970 [Chitinophagaceae bacterium]|nr:hypothetical protein [Chitinophagaceae bacterium]